MRRETTAFRSSASRQSPAYRRRAVAMFEVGQAPVPAPWSALARERATASVGTNSKRRLS